MNNINKSGCGAMKFFKISAVSMMLLSIGSTYALNAQAKTNDDKSKKRLLQVVTDSQKRIKKH